MNTAPRDAEADARVLRDRARALAQRPTAATAGDAAEWLLFRLGEDRFGVPAAALEGVLPLAELAPVPGTPDFLRGVLPVRGQLVAGLDLQRFLGLPVPGLADLHHAVLVRGAGLRVALLATAVEGMQPLPAEACRPPLPAAAGVASGHFTALTQDGAMLLDPERLLADPRLRIDDPG